MTDMMTDMMTDIQHRKSTIGTRRALRRLGILERWGGTATIAVLLLAVSSSVWAQKRVTIGLYVPNLPGVGRTRRIKAVETLARKLAQSSGLQIAGRSFASRKDLARAARKRQVQVAIVPAQLAAEKGWRPFASLTRRGARSRPWVIVASPQVKQLTELKGKKLVMSRIGRTDKRFVVNVLLESEVDPSYFRWQSVADSASAIRTVKLGKAAAAVVPAGGSTSGLKVVFRSRPAPLPVAVWTRKLPADQRAKFRGALLKWSGGWLGFSSWVAAKRAATKGLRGRLYARGARRRPATVQVRAVRLKQRDVLTAYKPKGELPSPLKVVSLPKIKPDTTVALSSP